MDLIENKKYFGNKKCVKRFLCEICFYICVMEEKKREIVMQAAAVYMQNGIKSMTMDEMARQLSVSKKTLYQYVTDKNDLVMQCIELNHDMEEEFIKEVIETKSNAIEQMLAISSFIIGQLQQIHPSIFFDLNKYHPEVIKRMECHKDEFVCGCIENNLTVGIKQGLYRDNLNPQVISQMHLAFIDSLMHGTVQKVANIGADEVYSEFFRYHVRGIASEKGLEFLSELVKKDPSLSKQF